jgi:hypothetical protein
VNILILSDNFTKDSEPEKAQNIDIEYVTWTEERMGSFINEFHVVIMDLNFSSKRTTFSPVRDLYLYVENELKRKMIEEEGLVVVVICGHKDEKLFDYDILEEAEPGDSGKYRTGTYTEPEPQKKPGEKRTYSFLSKIDMDSYEVIEFAPIGRRYTPPDSKLFRDYFDNVECFYLTLPAENNDNLSVISKAQGVGSRPVSFERRIGKGSIIYLPKYNSARKREAFNSLLKICQEYYLRQQNNIYEQARAKSKSEIPEWVQKYRTDRHDNIPNEINTLRKEEEFFDRICYLLYGKDERLEDEVGLVLSEFGISTKKATKGESIDLICSAETAGFEFFVEVTSSNRSVDIKKVAQFLDIRRRYPDIKVVIVANAFCNLDLHERIDKDKFTEKMVNALAPFDVLMMTTVDLYFLWKGMYEKGLDKTEVLTLLRESKGIFEWPDGLSQRYQLMKEGKVNEKLLL